MIFFYWVSVLKNAENMSEAIKKKNGGVLT